MNSLKPLKLLEKLIEDETKKFKTTLDYFKGLSDINKQDINKVEFDKNKEKITELVKLYLERNKNNLDWKEREELENYINFLRDYLGEINIGVMKEINGARNPNNMFPEKKSLLGRLNPFKGKGGAIKLRSKKNKRSKRKTHNRKHV